MRSEASKNRLLFETVCEKAGDSAQIEHDDISVAVAGLTKQLIVASYQQKVAISGYRHWRPCGTATYCVGSVDVDYCAGPAGSIEPINWLIDLSSGLCIDYSSTVCGHCAPADIRAQLLAFKSKAYTSDSLCLPVCQKQIFGIICILIDKVACA